MNNHCDTVSSEYWLESRRIILARRSVRHFDHKKIDDPLVNEIFLFCSRLLVVLGVSDSLKIDFSPNKEDNARLGSEIKKGANPQPREASHCVIVYKKNVPATDNDARTLIAAGILIEGILLKATSIGVDSLWISSFDENKVKEIFDNKYPFHTPLAVIPLGYRSRPPRAARRFSVYDRTYFENFQSRLLNFEEIFDEARKVNAVEYIDDISHEESLTSELNEVLDAETYRDKIKFVSDVCHDLYSADFMCVIQNALEAAKWAPSAKNLQSTEFMIIMEEEHRKRVGRILDVDLDNVALIALFGNLNRAKKVGTLSTHSTTTSERAERLFVFLDGGAAIQNIVFSLHAMGYESNWFFESAKQSLVFSWFGLPDVDYVYLGYISVSKA